MADEPLQNQNDTEPVHRIPSADSVADAFAEFELMPHEKPPQAAPAGAPAAPAPVPAPVPAAAVKPPRPPVPPAAPPVQPIQPVPQPKTQAPEPTSLPKIVVMPKGPPAKAPEPPRAAPAPEVLLQKPNVPQPPRPNALPQQPPVSAAAPSLTPPLPPTPTPPVTPAPVSTPAAASPVAPLASPTVPPVVAPAPLSAPAPASALSPSPLSAAARPAPRPETSLMDQALAAKLPDKLPPRMPEAPMGKLTEDLPLGVHVQEAPKLVVGQESAPQGPTLGQKAVAPAPAKKPPVSVVESLKEQAQTPLHPLRTLRLDVEESVKEHKTSLVSVAAAEEDRRAKAEAAPPLVEEEMVEQKPKRSLSWLVAIVSIIFLLGGLGALAYVFLPRVAAPAKPQSPTLPASTIIFVDEVVQVPFDGKGHTEALSAFSSLRDSTNLSLGLIRELYPTVTATTTGALSRVSASDLMRIVAPSASDELLRTLDPLYVLGAHVFDGNQAFLILKTNAYEQAYSGLIAWEPSMRGELLPLFDRRPRPRGPGEQLSTTSAPSVIQTGFSDAVIENHDARVYKDADGNVVLLWTFVDRSTIVITTNDRTLREIITRLRHAPIQGL